MLFRFFAVVLSALVLATTASAVDLADFARPPAPKTVPTAFFAVVAANKRVFGPNAPMPTEEEALLAAQAACEEKFPGDCWVQNGHSVVFPAHIPTTIAVVFCQFGEYYGTFPGGARLGGEQRAQKHALRNAQKGGYPSNSCQLLHFVDIDFTKPNSASPPLPPQRPEGGERGAEEVGE